jgi:prevent-host-death family protein
MNEIEVTMSELRQQLGSLVNRAAYGRERVVLIAHGEPKAAIVSVDDLQRLEQLDAGLLGISSTADQILSVADALHQQIYQWQFQQGIEPEDVTTTLDQLRQELDNEPDNLR